MSHFGLLNLDKPAGMTSRQAVDCVKRVVRPAKVGHAGTLDPLATGVLVVCVGPATRLIEYVQEMPKRYTGTFRLGCRSDSEDVETEVAILENPPVPSHGEIESAAARLTGDIQQRPPAFSALKVNGRRAYDLARRGKAVDLQPRTVRIDAIEILRYDYPQLVLDIRCGSGTYIRSLGRDLAESLQTAAVMTELARTEIGPFSVADAVAPADVSKQSIAGILQPARLAVASLPTLELSSEEVVEISHGRLIRRAVSGDEQEYAAVDAHGRLIALVVPRGRGQLGPFRTFTETH